MRNESMLKYLISDMDHTLLHNDGRLDLPTISAVRQSSIKLCLASARNPYSMVEFINQLGLTGPQLAMNGALIFQVYAGKVQVLRECAISRELARQLAIELQSLYPEVDFTWITRDHWYIPKMTPAMREEMKYSGVQPVIGRQLQDTAAPDQIVLIIKDQQLFSEVQHHLQQRFSDLSIHSSGDGYLTINAAGVNKGNLVQYLIDHGIQRSEIAGVGDDQNDLPLLQVVGHSLAVANAIPEVKTQVTEVINSNEEDGIAQFLSQFID
ncbi:Cof-like hydrolase [Limosilactobacillus coleohominis 101-4-CHN]|uniref:Cof-like hydrolase n=2 Tax=Limosilactobacillus coleohominis TaxID=181675 RepID=C7XW74_9LACO|nr:Cof-like hydrolase [Limosilactobacillus coleohominis 101-4-CHN]